MSVFIADISAVEYWRHATGPFSKSRSRAGLARARVPSTKEAEQLVSAYSLGMGKPLHVLVADKSAWRHNDGVVCHVCSQPLPEGAFCLVEDGVYVSAPELLLLQRAKSLSIPQAAAAGDELCARYFLDDEDKSHTRGSAPSSVSQMRTFADKAHNIEGGRIARRALQYMVDGANSPMEVRTEIRLCFPRYYGGYGLMPPTMNGLIELDEYARRLSGTQCCYGDLYWPQARIDVEYDGRRDHEGEEKIMRNNGRDDAIQHMGILVKTVTWLQYKDLQQFECIAKDIAKELGMKFQKPDQAKARELYGALFKADLL